MGSVKISKYSSFQPISVLFHHPSKGCISKSIHFQKCLQKNFWRTFSKPNWQYNLQDFSLKYCRQKFIYNWFNYAPSPNQLLLQFLIKRIIKHNFPLFENNFSPFPQTNLIYSHVHNIWFFVYNIYYIIQHVISRVDL